MAGKPMKSPLRTCSRLVSVAAFLTGCLVLVGWVLDVAALKSVAPSLVAMKANTALNFVLLGASLWLLAPERVGRRRRRAAQGCALLVAAIGALTLGEYVLGWDAGIDQWLFREPAGAVGTSHPGRMAPITAVNFALLGIALLLLDVETRRGRRPAHYLALVAALAGLLGLVGYVFSVQPLYRVVPSFTQIALHTTVLFVLLGLGVLAARPDRGLMAMVTGEHAGSFMLRRMLPAMIVVMVILSWLRLEGERLRLYSSDYGVALFLILRIVILAAVIWICAALLNKIDVRRKEAEQERARLAAVLEGTPDFVGMADVRGRVLYINRAGRRMMGWREDEDVTKAVIPDCHPPWARKIIREEGVLAALRDGVWSGETAIQNRDGRETPVLQVILAHRAPDGSAQFLSTIARDITERNRANEQLRETAAELARSNAELEQFAYIASHDLQEPLRAVAGYVQLLERRYADQLDANALHYIARAAGAAKRMQTLINDLLVYSRVGTRGKPFEPTDCGKVLEDALTDLRIAIEEGGAVVTHDVLPTVMADASQLRQLFQNLVGNAIKFRGGQPALIEVAARRAGPAWEFSVRDNGIGIPAEHFERIFQIFQRLHTREEYPGTGIGLAVCKKIVERHGGRIWVEAEPGQGSAFHFTIPDRGGEEA